MTLEAPNSARRGAAALLMRRPQLWGGATAVAAVVIFLLSLAYFGGIVDPGEKLRHLPVAVVNQDRLSPGNTAGKGAQIADALIARADKDQRLRLQPMSMAEATDRLDSGSVYGALVIPPDFSTRLHNLLEQRVATAPEQPEVTLLTNPRAGSLGVSFTSGGLQPAWAAVSRRIGHDLLAQPAARSAAPAARLLLADPLKLTVTPYRPLPANSGIGLSAFYYTVLILLAGYLGASVISGIFDTAVGHAFGEAHASLTYRSPVAISRTRLFLAKCATSAALGPVAATMIASACLLLGVDTPHAALLWVFTSAAIAAVGIGQQALVAAFGSLAPLLGTFIFMALALPSSGGTVPLQALPSFFRFLSLFEPARHIIGGVRSIMYFDARGDAGLAGAWAVTGLAASGALLFGLFVTRRLELRPRLSGQTFAAVRGAATQLFTGPTPSPTLRPEDGAHCDSAGLNTRPGDSAGLNSPPGPHRPGEPGRSRF
ncbi:DUF3533 domain-containing protein [Streptomyces actinomycinicus]|uniref:DUF3533 domain-containing protein n=1 Tax=Streptomyces actinomycinicus TaxID=1695166 RepID=A0A937EK64_9ACTN|nr:DUF3533 domain-containing protein [Streptomyces actinomycinicus]MBL1083474.1 DUF3533 domain-containing protein [Streptomyces actinomycinicus]